MATNNAVILGIDFGMTATGVAYWIQKTNVEGVIHKWPSKDLAVNSPLNTVPEPTEKTPATPGQGAVDAAEAADRRRTEYKVPTRLEYPNTNNENRQVLWGYLCARPGEPSERELKELFKFYLNEDTLRATIENNPESVLPSVEVAQQWITDFVKELNEHVKKQLGGLFSVKEWRSAEVEYHFSVPTTWPPHVNEKFREAIGDSGVGGGHRETRNIELAEAEAAAVQVVREHVTKLQAGDTLIVCDAGGGTTDISTIEILDLKKEVFKFKQLISPSGETIGSVQIDIGFATLVDKYLEENASEYYSSAEPPRDYPGQLIANSDFLLNKRQFGETHKEHYTYRLHNLPRDFNKPESEPNGIKIEEGIMVIHHGIIGKLFDEQVEGLCTAINNQLDKPTGKGRGLERGLGSRLGIRSGKSIKIALCGGLGSSCYVRRCLKLKYPSIEILSSEEPLLAVCKGLVTSRRQEIFSKISPCASRRCPKSYGILYNEPCDGTLHKNHNRAITHHKAINQKRYVSNQVYWFIKEDGEYKNPSAVPKFFRLAKLGQAPRGWTDKIVESAKNDRGWEFLCDVETSLGDEILSPATDGVTEKRTAWYSSNRYLRVDYEIRPTIKRTEFTVEVFFGGDIRGSSPPIRYHWNNKPDSKTPDIKWEGLPMKERS